MKALARAWPSRLRAYLSAQVLGELLLAVMLVVALGFSWRDGGPAPAFVYPGGPAGSANSSMAANNLHLYRPAHVSGSQAVAMAPPSQVLMPTSPPAQLLIPALNVHRPVEAVGVDRRGVMVLPLNWWNAGWYQGGPVPGAPGDAVIEGHAGYPGQPLIFGKLSSLRQGDRIIVTLSDGSQQLFLVESMTTVGIGEAPPGFAEPYGPPRLTLVTCTGHFNDKTYSYSQRLVVEASYAGLV